LRKVGSWPESQLPGPHLPMHRSRRGLGVDWPLLCGARALSRIAAHVNAPLIRKPVLVTGDGAQPRQDALGPNDPVAPRQESDDHHRLCPIRGRWVDETRPRAGAAAPRCPLPADQEPVIAGSGNGYHPRHLANRNQSMARQDERVGVENDSRMAAGVAHDDTAAVSPPETATIESKGSLYVHGGRDASLAAASRFVSSQYLRTPWTCPVCKSQLLYGNGVMSVVHCCDTETGEVKQALACFCSTTCLLRAPHDVGIPAMSPHFEERQHYE
jgi:hypothetical protein